MRSTRRLRIAALVALGLAALTPASASAAASAWKLVSVRGEVNLHVEDSHASIPCEEASGPWVATGDYRNVLTSRTAIFGRGYGVYNGVFGTVIGGFQVDFRLHREATERVNVARRPARSRSAPAPEARRSGARAAADSDSRLSAAAAGWVP